MNKPVPKSRDARPLNVGMGGLELWRQAVDLLANVMQRRSDEPLVLVVRKQGFGIDVLISERADKQAAGCAMRSRR